MEEPDRDTIYIFPEGFDGDLILEAVLKVFNCEIKDGEIIQKVKPCEF